MDWLCAKIELRVRHTIGEIQTGDVRFHAIIQVEISIRSFDQNALLVYFSRKDFIRSDNFSLPNLHFLHKVFISVLRAGKGSLRNLSLHQFTVAFESSTDFLNYYGT